MDLLRLPSNRAVDFSYFLMGCILHMLGETQVTKDKDFLHAMPNSIALTLATLTNYCCNLTIVFNNFWRLFVALWNQAYTQNCSIWPQVDNKLHLRTYLTDSKVIFRFENHKNNGAFVSGDHSCALKKIDDGHDSLFKMTLECKPDMNEISNLMWKLN